MLLPVPQVSLRLAAPQSVLSQEKSSEKKANNNTYCHPNSNPCRQRQYCSSVPPVLVKSRRARYRFRVNRFSRRCCHPFHLSVFVALRFLPCNRLPPDHSTVSDEVMAFARRLSPNRARRVAVDGDPFSVVFQVPPTRVNRQNRQCSAPAWTSEVDGPIFHADPQFTFLDLAEFRKYFREPGNDCASVLSSQLHRIFLPLPPTRIIPSSTTYFAMRGVPDSPSPRYCPDTRFHSIIASTAAMAFTSGS